MDSHLPGDCGLGEVVAVEFAHGQANVALQVQSQNNLSLSSSDVCV